MRVLLLMADLIRLTLAAFLILTCLWLARLAVEPTAYSLAIAAGVYALILIYQVANPTHHVGDSK